MIIYGPCKLKFSKYVYFYVDVYVYVDGRIAKNWKTLL